MRYSLSMAAYEKGEPKAFAERLEKLNSSYFQYFPAKEEEVDGHKTVVPHTKLPEDGDPVLDGLLAIRFESIVDSDSTCHSFRFLLLFVYCS